MCKEIFWTAPFYRNLKGKLRWSFLNKKKGGGRVFKTGGREKVLKNLPKTRIPGQIDF